MSGSANGGRQPGSGAKQRPRREPPPLPRRPYRDSALLHAVLGLVIVVVAALTGGSLLTGVLVALVYFALATTWSWMRFRQRLRAVSEQGEGDAGGRGERA